MLEELDPQAPLEKLVRAGRRADGACDGGRDVREPEWTPRQWWPRIMDDLTSRRFVLVIDNLEQLAAMEEALTDLFLWFWFARRFEEFLAGEEEAASLPDLLDKMIAARPTRARLTMRRVPARPGGLTPARR